MKWQKKLLWTLMIILVGIGIWILSYPFSSDDTGQIMFEKGVLDLRNYNFILNGAAYVTGEIGYIPNEIVYDDEFLDDELEKFEYVESSYFLDDSIYGAQGYGTYMFDILPPKWMPVIAIEVPDINTAYKIFANGEYLGSSGRVDSRVSISEPMTMTKRFIIPSDGERIRFMVHMSNFDHHNSGFTDPMVIGTPSQIMQRQINSTLREYLIITSALLIGLYHIAIYAMREDEVASLHFGLFSIFLALTLSFFGEKSIYNLYPLLAWSIRMQLGFFFSLVTILLLLRYVILLENRHIDTKIETILQASFLIIYAGMATSLGKSVQTQWISAYMTMIFVIAVYAFVQMMIHIKNNEVGMRFAAFGLLVAIAVFSYDLMDIYDEKYSSYGLFVFIFSQALALGFRYSESFKMNLNLATELRLNAKILAERNAEIIQAKNNLEDLNKELDGKVNERTEDIRLLLDHSGQAFLSVNENSKIQPGFSKLANVYMGDDIREADLWDIIYPDSSETAELMRAAIYRAMHEPSLLRRKSYMAILPDSLNFNGHELSVEYKWIKTDFKDQIMVIMTDVTYETTLVNQLNIEAKENWTNLKIILNSSEFWALYDEFEDFADKKAYQLIKSNIELPVLREQLMKLLHYFKGNFSIYGLNEVVNQLHEVESSLSETDDISRSDIEAIFRSTKIQDELKARLNRMASTEGVDIYAYRDAILISKNKLDDISREIEQRYGNAAADLLGEIKTLSHQPFKKLFDSYVDYVSLLGKDVGKEVNPLHISGGDFMIDPVPYESFSRSMVHVFRNIVDHGIEKPELRYERGKPAEGNIEMKISLKKDESKPFIRMEITDDGAGINEEQLIANISKSLDVEAEELINMERKDMLQYIFSPDVTTKRKGDIVSGRGLGMTIVKEEVADLGGTIEVDSVAKVGMNIVIEVPYRF